MFQSKATLVTVFLYLSLSQHDIILMKNHVPCLLTNNGPCLMTGNGPCLLTCNGPCTVVLNHSVAAASPLLSVLNIVIVHAFSFKNSYSPMSVVKQ